MKYILNWRWFRMFDHDIKIRGIYATHLKQLARNATNTEQPYIFDRYIDVYMNAAVIGLLKGEPIKNPDTTSQDTAQILLDVIAKERANFVFLYRLVMLLDRSSGLTVEQRIDRAFRDEGDTEHPEKMKDNMKLFSEYVLAGIEIMYDEIAKYNSSTKEMCDAAREMMIDFQEENENTTPEDFLKKYHIL